MENYIYNSKCKCYFALLMHSLRALYDQIIELLRWHIFSSIHTCRVRIYKAATLQIWTLDGTQHNTTTNTDPSPNHSNAQDKTK